MEDISTKKREIEAKMEEEKASIAWLTETLQKSDQLANSMLNILTSFEERLCNLEDTILPVHKETTDLQRRQGNIDKTLGLLDEVLNYHSVSSNLKPSIEEGPTGHLQDYLDHMEEIDEAIKFFEKNNPESSQLGVLRTLNDKARESLQKEFLLLLQRNSRPVPIVTIQDILNAMLTQNDTSSQTSTDELHLQHFSEQVMNDLATIANWLVEHRNSTDFMSMYSQIRSSMLLQSIQGIKNEGFKFNFDVSYAKKKPPMKRLQSEIVYGKKKLGPKKSTKQVIETLYGHKRAPSSIETSIIDEDEETESSKVDTFITCTGALLKLMQSEKDLMDSIIPPERHIPIFSQLVVEALTKHYQDAEIVCNLAKSKQHQLDHSAIQLVLRVLRYLMSVKQEFDALLKLVNVDTRKKFLNMISLMKETGTNILYEFTEKLKEFDKHVTMPKDGTVHQVTSNVTVFLEELKLHSDTAAIFDLTTDANGEKGGSDDSDNEKRVADFIARVLSVLSLNLTNKSKLYDTSALQAVFMLNNYNYIIKSLHKIGIMKMLQDHGQPNLEQDYDEAIEEEMKLYLRSWKRVTNHLEVDASVKSIDNKTHLKEKHKQAIKDKFKGFNTDLEDINQSHKQFTVPDVELKQRIYKSICDMVLPLYTEFLKRYRDIHFTKNLEKYVKYDVEKVSSVIASIYGVEEIVLTIE